MTELSFTYAPKAVEVVDSYAGISAIIVHPIPAAGQSSKIEFTSKLIVDSKLLLDGVQHVSFGYGPSGRVLAFNTGKQPTSSRVTKSGTISNKKLHSLFINDYKLDGSIESLLEVSEVKKSAEDILYVEIIGELTLTDSIEFEKSVIKVEEKTVAEITEKQLDVDEDPFK